MIQIINFCDNMCFSTLWGSDVCKLIILFSFIQLIFILIKLFTRWNI